MNLGTALMRIFEGTDDQADLDPRDATGAFDLTLQSARNILGYVREALGIVASWRTPQGRRLRFKANQGEAFWTAPETGADEGLSQADWILPTQMASSRRYVTLPARFAAEDNAYAGAVLKLNAPMDGSVTPEEYLVIGSVGAELRLLNPVDASIGLDMNPFMLHRRKFSLGSLGLTGFIAMRAIARANDLTEIAPEMGYAYGLPTLKSVGTPSAYRIEDGYLHFDMALETGTTFLIRYWRVPALLENTDLELPLPEMFHPAIVHLAKASIFRRQGETAEAYEAWKAAEALLNVLRTEDDFERDEMQGTLRPRSL